MPLALFNGNPAANDRWEQVAAGYFPPSEWKQPRTVNRLFVSHTEKLLYAPIAKCACTSIKNLILDLSDVRHKALIVEHGIHRVTDKFKTGAKLNDYDPETIEKVLNSDKYYKFTIIRDPVRRVISAYTEKFLYNRLQDGNQAHTLHPLQTVRCATDVDFDEGISFREFAEYLLQTDPYRMDTHWAPQHMFLPGVPRFDRVYTTDQMDQLSAHLSERAGKSIEVGKFNASLRPRVAQGAQDMGQYVDLLPSELDKIEGIKAHHFMAQGLVERLYEFYHEDAQLFRKAELGLHNYVPEPSDLCPPPLRLNALKPRDTGIPLSAAPDLARAVNLFSKGFFVLSEQEQNWISIILANKLPLPLSFERIPSMHLVYTLYDSNENELHCGVSANLNEKPLMPGGRRPVMLPLAIPLAVIPQARKLIIELRFGGSYAVKDISPLHATVAHRVAVD